jgi:tRNA threonylcarbamoyladenosine biosynthesis protein TsaB
MPNFLFIDTATSACHVGLSVDGQLVAEKSETEAFKHAELLTKLVAVCMDQAGLSYGQLDAVVITGGPGSYTGLRIGASVAKGLCFGSFARLIALNTLEVMATGYRKAHPECKGYLVPVIDARRMEVFCAVYKAEGGSLKAPAPCIIDEQSFTEYETQTLHFFGDGAEKIKSSFRGKANFDSAFYLSPSAMLSLAQEAFSLGKFESVAYYRPDYHKEFYSPMSK